MLTPEPGAAASLSRNLWQSDASPGLPPLLHSLRELRSVLSLAASDLYIFCGSQSHDIPVRLPPGWDGVTYSNGIQGMGQEDLSIEREPSRTHWICIGPRVRRGT